jgi:hypothetical protein
MIANDFIEGEPSRYWLIYQIIDANNIIHQLNDNLL